jgi:molecular chaperone IbpA
MSNLLSFTPLMRSTVGFDRFNDLVEQLALKSDERFDAYPPYNIEKTGDDAYRITMAVAGFSANDVAITAQGDSLTVSASVADKKEDEETTYLHRGIASRSFQRSFRLADHVKVKAADMRDGMLVISLQREVPEEAKPRMVPINAGGATTLESREQANKIN